jgi:hypothetical protein
MKKLLPLFILIPFFAIGQYRFAFKLANVYSSAYFEENNSNIFNDIDPNSDDGFYRRFHINSENSMDWPETASTSFLTDIGRRYSMELSIEKKISNKFFISTGFELGGRFFSVKYAYVYKNSNNISEDPFIFRSYRNFSVPFSASYQLKINKRFSVKPNAGFSINMPESYSDRNFLGNYIIKSYSPLYFMLTVGTEINYNLKNGNAIALSAIYSQGFKNIIDDIIPTTLIVKNKWFDTANNIYYDGSKDGTPIRVASNGTNFSLGIKYYFLPFGSNKPKLDTKINFTKIDFSKRLLNKPMEIIVDTNYIKLCMWDDQRIDGDSVAIEYKDSIIYNNVRLDATKKCIWIKVEKGQPNYLIVHALNEGRVKPNTVRLSILNKEQEMPVLIKTDLTKSGILNITFP